jgi:solute carrier family 7 (cationic amino acid transporter), member 3
VIGTSSVARGLSGYIDTLLPDGYRMAEFWRSILPMDIDFLAQYPDFFAFAIVMVLACLLAFGVKESTFLNNIFTVVNLVTISIVLVAGSLRSKPSNWAIDKEEIPTDLPNGVDAGEGGFMPFGIAGVMAGAAKCFYGFVGFDCIATTGEEAKNPKRNIPLAIVVSLIIIFFAYFGISTVLTMMVPYYLQNPEAPLPDAFKQNDMYLIANIISIGAIFALSTSLLGAMFPLPRVLYAMGNDGVIYKIFKKVHPKTQTPLIATILSGILASVMALIFDLEQLIDMMSIGTLLAYTIVAICVLILHYESPQSKSDNFKSMTKIEVLRQITNFKFTQDPTKLSSDIVKISVSIFCILCIALCTLLEFSITAPIIIGLVIVSVALLLIILIIYRQPRDTVTELTFKVPLVPILPCLSILMNLYLMFQLDTNTWIRFGVWLAIGK